jgi:nucleoside 2-deoxyribosyltransferase
MGMKYYIAAHSQEDAKHLKVILESHGNEVTSRWIESASFGLGCYSEDDRRRIAAEDCEDVKSCDALILLESPGRVPGGKFVEAGFAMGLGKPIYIIGRRENMLMWHPFMIQYDDLGEFVVRKVLK